MGKYLNLVWRIPVAIIGGGLGYYLTKYLMVYFLQTFSVYMDAATITLLGTFAPLAVPVGLFVWAVKDFIFPQPPPNEPPTRGGYFR